MNGKRKQHFTQSSIRASSESPPKPPTSGPLNGIPLRERPKVVGMHPRK